LRRYKGGAAGMEALLRGLRAGAVITATVGLGFIKPKP
jgi:hypothetical protein